MDTRIPIPGYEDSYAVDFGPDNPKGAVISFKKSFKVLKPKTNKHGYKIVNLYANGKIKTFKIHRLIALAAIPNPDNLPFVCHKDDDPSNNHPDNLFWGTPKDNSQDMIKKNRQRLKKIPVICYTPDGNVYYFESIREAMRQTNIDSKTIWKICHRKGRVRDTRGRKSRTGYIWKFAYSEDNYKPEPNLPF